MRPAEARAGGTTLPDGDARPPVVGFVGLGDQGLPIAQAIADGGFPLHVWARRPGSLEALEGHAFTAEPGLAELGAVSDVVILCLPEDHDVRAVVLDGGLLAAMRPGTVLVNQGTGLPAEALRLGELTEPRGVACVDAPVSGGHAVAVARQLTTIAGGTDDAVALVRPVFDTFSKEVIHAGPSGSGQYGKLFNNTLMMMNHTNLIEVLHVAQAADVPLPGLLQVLRSGSARSFALEAIGPSITTENVDHLRTLEIIDMDVFAEAVSFLGGVPARVVERAVAGANGLPDLTRTVLKP